MAGPTSPAAATTRGCIRTAAGHPTAPRAKNFSLGERMAFLTAARDHWTELRGRCTGDKTRRTGKDLTDAFVDNAAAEDKAYVATRDAKSLDRKLKNLRASYGIAAKKASRTGASTSEKEDALIKFGGAVLFGMAQAVFKDCPVSNELTGVKPVNLLQTASAQPGSGDAGAVGAAAGVGGRAERTWRAGRAGRAVRAVRGRSAWLPRSAPAVAPFPLTRHGKIWSWPRRPATRAMTKRTTGARASGATTTSTRRA
eukprot:TRINITY_DN16831_c0_g1_i1.p1 TRINITY_DN16831_c0_g1~~TRINITY_DN16831_c0_g1_i1.p1  ORF type:complete len:255 (-),score=14.17 TRINITY_DN16831_c0_g1_i1:167-931(-)